MGALCSSKKLSEKMEYWEFKVEVENEIHEILYGIEHTDGDVVGVLVKNQTTEKVVSLTCFELFGLLDILYHEKFTIKETQENAKEAEILGYVQ